MLLPYLELDFDDMGIVTVADVLADPDRFVDETLADPLEGADYGRCKAKVMRADDGSLFIHSFAHGRSIYQLKGEMPGTALVDELIEKAGTDPGAPFAPDAIDRLAQLKMLDQAAFETARSKLKKAGCRVTELDNALAAVSGDDGHRPTQADVLLRLGQPATLFHTADSTGYADIDVDGHRETWPIRSKGFKQWLMRRYYDEEQGAPNSEALQSALNTIEARALHGAPEHTVYVRVGGTDDSIYLDLCDEKWRAVEITGAGWRVIESPPVRFRRCAGMRPLPIPVPGGTIEELRPFLNVKTDADFVLAVAWMVAALRPCGPYPILVLAGEQGTAKSTFLGFMKALLDPNTAPLRALPREDRDMFIAATNGHVLAFDNVSGIPSWLSDTMCRLSTGGGFAVRSLYTDGDEKLFDARRPQILNGIEDIVEQPDLGDRSLFLTLEPISVDKRQSEKQLRATFEPVCPRLLGALLDGVAEGLKNLPGMRLEKTPRMADFALWAASCETAFWKPGDFMAAYADNRDDAITLSIEGDPVAAAVRDMTAMQGTWSGTATELLAALRSVSDQRRR